MSKVIMGIGIPGSGKTTILRPLAEKSSYIYISPDDIRLELLKDQADQSKNAEIWKEAHERTARALSQGKTVVFDATFAKDFERKDFIRFVRKNGAREVEGVFAEVPLETAHERNVSRGRVVPRHAIERMHAMLLKSPPRIADGFDRIFNMKEFEENIKN